MGLKRSASHNGHGIREAMDELDTDLNRLQRLTSDFELDISILHQRSENQKMAASMFEKLHSVKQRTHAFAVSLRSGLQKLSHRLTRLDDAGKTKAERLLAQSRAVLFITDLDSMLEQARSYRADFVEVQSNAVREGVVKPPSGMKLPIIFGIVGGFLASIINKFVFNNLAILGVVVAFLIGFTVGFSLFWLDFSQCQEASVRRQVERVAKNAAEQMKIAEKIQTLIREDLRSIANQLEFLETNLSNQSARGMFNLTLKSLNSLTELIIARIYRQGLFMHEAIP
mmetsp:Transcript_22178/g.31050  ORF Transcript_22178/g.31050 Transcript_22178/m.31050 type:complete len:284 (-) Transcript_22178:97-948(-)|eukprot:CAMPEP_0185256024 /NCGR_PEP_ID=MMETSP1359-20130426/5087_1 /TAXON_ID=552665 /ORGANISM="Bigelowiella longifila, Strain CCMP242" /LENGTH=283 /DNA_ID=CAMNT_0027840323 /DNA_START=144 /DNA_END=995 /DNA_ORIENTATION=+